MSTSLEFESFGDDNQGMPTLSPDTTIPAGVARRLLSERGHRDFTGEVTDGFIEAAVMMPYPTNCRDQHAWNADSRALNQWLIAQQDAGQAIDFDGIAYDFAVVPWCYGRVL